MGNARQHQEQSQLGEPAVTEGGAQTQSVGDLLQRQQQAEDASQLGALREVGGLVELPAQQAAEGFNPGRGPVRQVSDGAILDLAILPEGFAQEEGRRGVAVGDGGDIHDFFIQLIKSNVKDNLTFTCLPYVAQIPPTFSNTKTSINYCEEDTYEDIEQAAQQGVALYMAPKGARNPARRGQELDPKPGDSEAVKAWKQRMGSEEGKQIYKQRGATSETINADLRTYRGLGRITVRGLAKIRCVALWCALAYNLMHFGSALLT